MINALVI